ncbi:WSC-domain-containing protein [Auriscalpium vulgare]|uniref:WSC-domain-containing protein n=1 Tax=Auriscalpium vulgare TaxID=40419 RepID=A0ACB8RBF9_9AGAM|nr:WSC-domain-containing protein [Auriscalpium vulgare]
MKPLPCCLPSSHARRIRDTASARTLADATFSSSTSMSVEACTAFCEADAHVYAGVEFGRQCFCDYALQNPGTPTSLEECNLPCSGNASETCGAANRINLYWNGQSGPSILPPLQLGDDHWEYAGCYTDDTNARTLPHLAPTTRDQISNAEEVNCVIACDALGYYFAGVEFGTECWCGNEVGSGAVLAPDSDCHYVCAGDPTHSEFCGGRERLTVFHKDICVDSSVAHFWLVAFFNPEPPTSPIGRYLILSPSEDGYSVLTANLCDECCGVGIELDITDRTLTAEGSPVLGALPLRDGESPVFSAGQPALQNYCSTQLDPQSVPLLAGNGRSDEWALCPNTTAGGRLDVVFAPIANHPHYAATDCTNVFMQIVSSPNDC